MAEGASRKAGSLVSVVGARPQFIKAAMVERAIARRSAGSWLRHRLIHTGQHFEFEMSGVFFQTLPLPKPAHHLRLGGLEPAAQLGRMVERLTALYRQERPAAVIVYGDTTTTLGAALAASLAGVPCAHVEAGLRSFNPEMPEERNRVLTDRLARWLFCPSHQAAANLAAEGRTQGVHVVGDVMVDALTMARRALSRDPAVLKRLGLRPGGYYLATLHRAENTRDAARVIEVLDTLDTLNAPAVLPLHPRTRNLLRGAGWRPTKTGGLRVLPPVPYSDMLALERSARAILTDSGGVQKEAYFWGVPCLTLREETEWTETLERGWNRLVRSRAAAIRRAVASLNGVRQEPRPPLYGDGRAAGRIVDMLIAGVR